MAHTEGYDIVPAELRVLKFRWPEYFLGFSWPRYAMTIKVALSDEQVMELAVHWSLRYRGYDQKIAWENGAVDEKYEERMQQRLAYWSRVWDSSRVKLIHAQCYTGFQHPTEEQCHAAEKTATQQKLFGRLD